MKFRITWLEIVIIILFLGLLGGVVFIAVNPWLQARRDLDTRRWQDVLNLSNALTVYQVDHQGRWPLEISDLKSGEFYLIGTKENNCNGASACRVSLNEKCVNFDFLIADNKLKILPISPSVNISWNEESTGYYLRKNIDETLTVGACEKVTDNVLEVTR